MLYKLKVSPTVADKLCELSKTLENSYGAQRKTEIISHIKSEVKDLQTNPYKGTSVEAILNVRTPYRFLHTEHNFIFYKVDNYTVFVTEIFNEKEDFLQRMFGVRLRTQESIDYWGD